MSFIRNHVGRVSAGDHSNVQSGWAEQGVHRHFRLARTSCERVQKLVDGGIAQFGISGVRHLAARNYLIPEATLGTESQACFPWAHH